jgi:hypothetical protein
MSTAEREKDIFLTQALAKEKEENQQLEEECAFLMALILRKHYRTLAETQFCCSMRRKHVYVLEFPLQFLF